MSYVIGINLHGRMDDACESSPPHISCSRGCVDDKYGFTFHQAADVYAQTHWTFPPFQFNNVHQFDHLGVSNGILYAKCPHAYTEHT